jgi:hypothetical protein
LLPTKEAVQAAAACLGSRTPPDERLCIAFAPGEDAYPLINYEYAIVSTKQAAPATAAAIMPMLPMATICMPLTMRKKPQNCDVRVAKMERFFV